MWLKCAESVLWKTESAAWSQQLATTSTHSIHHSVWLLEFRPFSSLPSFLVFAETSAANTFMEESSWGEFLREASLSFPSFLPPFHSDPFLQLNVSSKLWFCLSFLILSKSLHLHRSFSELSPHPPSSCSDATETFTLPSLPLFSHLVDDHPTISTSTVLDPFREL